MFTLIGPFYSRFYIGIDDARIINIKFFKECSIMKFMRKNKKGFTLVELMIVVVIMAILVAVAVPIYNAVTDKAREKTCYANERTIVEQLSNYLMMNDIGNDTDTFTVTITTNADGDSASTVVVTGEEAALMPEATFTGLFTTIPFNPSAGGTITVTAEKSGGSWGISIDASTYGSYAA